MARLLVVIMCVCLVPLCIAKEMSEEQKIEKLLKIIEKADASFLRNGKEHPASVAKDHLKMKMDRATRQFWFFGPKKKITAQEFVTHIASKSSTTGKPYLLKLQDGKIQEVGPWLHGKLKELEKEVNKE